LNFCIAIYSRDFTGAGHMCERLVRGRCRTVLPAQRSEREIITALSAAQQAWRQHCEQTSPRRNIWTITNSNWKIKKNRSSHTVLHISNGIYGRYILFIWLLVL